MLTLTITWLGSDRRQPTLYPQTRNEDPDKEGNELALETASKIGDTFSSWLYVNLPEQQ